MRFTPRLRMTVRMRVGVVAAAIVSFGCDSGVSSMENDGSFEIQPSQLSIRVTNTAGQALTRIRVAIVLDDGRATEFTVLHTRMESSERRDFSLALFRSNYPDIGTPFNLRVHNPRSVKVSGVNLDGKTRTVEVPWD